MICGVDNVDGTILRITNAIRDAVRSDILTRILLLISLPTSLKKRKIEFEKFQMRTLHMIVTGKKGVRK